MSVGVRQHTKDVCVCPSAHTRRLWLSVCVRVCPSAHTGHPWLSISTHISTFVLGLRTLALPMDCLGVFGPRGLSVQYIEDVCGCPSAYTGCPCVRQDTQDVRVCPSAHTGHPWLSISTHISTLLLGLNTMTLPVDCSGNFGPRWLSVQYAQYVRGCPPAHTGCPWLSMAVCGCPSAHTGCMWLSVCIRVCACVSVSTHRTSVAVHQYTYQHAVHTGRLWVSASTHMTSLAVRVCPAHTGRPWLSVCVRVGPRVSVCVRQHTQDVRGCPSSVQYTQNVRGCLSAHTGRPYVFVSTLRTSVAVVCVRVCPSAHSGCSWLSISTHISTLVLGLSTLTLSVDSSGDFGPRGLSVHKHRTSMCVRQHTQDVRGCPCVSVNTHKTSVAVCGSLSAHTGRPWLCVCVHVCLCVSVSTHRTSVAVYQYTYQHAGPWTQHPGPSRGLFGTSVAVRQHTQDVRGCPCVSVSTHRTSVAVHQYTYQLAGPWTQHAGANRGLFDTHRTFVAVRVCPSAHAAHPKHRTSMCVRQHTQDVRGCPCVSVSTDRTLVAVCGSLSAHTGRPTHISTLVLGLNMLALPVDCLGDFGPRGQSVQYTQDVCGCPPAHTGRLWLSVSTHRTFVAVRVCLCVSLSTHRTSVAVHQYTYQHAGPWTQHAGAKRGLFETFVAVRVCPSAHTAHPWLSISTHISTLFLGLSTLALPVDCLGDFGPRGLCVQYTQDVTHRTSVALRVCLCVSVCVRQHTQDVHGCPSVHISACWSLDSPCWPIPWTVRLFLARGGCLFSTHKTSVGVRQHTHDVCGCPCLSVSTHRTSVCVRVCPRVSVCVRQHTQDDLGCPSVHISARLSLDSARWSFPWTVWVILAHVGCPFSTHRMSVGVRKDTQDVHVCPSGHTGRPWLFVCVRQHTQDVRGCPSVHISALNTGRPWVSVSTHRMSVCVRQHTQDVCGCPCVFVSTHMTSLAVCDSLSAHIGRPWLSVCVHVCPSAHTGRPWLTHRMSLGVRQHTQDVRGYPWLSVSTHRTSVAVRVCPCVSVNTHRTYVAVHQYTYQHAGPWTQHAGANCGLFGTSVCARQHTQDIRGCPCVSVSTHSTSVAVHQYTYKHVVHTCRLWLSVAVCQHPQDVRGCPFVSVSTHRTSVAVRGSLSAHTGRLWLSVCVRVCPSTHAGGPWLSISTHISTLVLGFSTLALTVDCSVDFIPRRLSVQYTQDFCGCPSAHTGRPCVSVSTHRTFVAVRVCPSAHKAHPWLSISTHISTLVLGLSTLALPVDCLGDFGPRGLSVQYTQDVCGCPWLSVSTHRTSVAVRVCLCVSVCVRQHTQDVHGCPSFIQDVRGCLWLSVSTHRTSMAVHHTHRTSVAVRGCPSAPTGRPWLSVCVCVCLCVSISTHRTSVAVHKYIYQHAGPWTHHAGPSGGLFGTHSSTLVLGLSTLALHVDCSGDFGTRGLSAQYIQDIHGCPSAHTERLYVSVCVRVCPCVSVAVRVCPCVSVSTLGTSVAVHQYTYQHVVPWTQHADPSRGLFGTHRTSVPVRVCPSAHTGDPWLSIINTGCPWVSVSTHRRSVAVRVCPSGLTGRLWLSVALCQHTQDVRVCPCVSVSTLGTSVAVHQYTNQHVGPWTQHADPSRGLFGTSMCVHQHTQDVRGCSCVSVSTHRTSVAVHQYTYQHVGPRNQHADPSRGQFGTSVCVRQNTQDVRGCPCVSVSTHRTSVAVCGSLSAHTGYPWLSVCVRVCLSAHIERVWLSISTHISTLVLGLTRLAPPVDCSGDFGPRGLSVQYTQDVRGSPTSVAVRVCLCVFVSTLGTSLAVHQYTYQHVGPWTQHADPFRGLFGTSMCVRQHTQDVRGCSCVSVSTHRTFVAVHQYTFQHVVNIGRPWVSVSTHRTSVCVRQHTQDVCGCLCVSVSTHRTSVAVCGSLSAHTGRLCLSVCVHVCLCVSVSTHVTSVAVHQYTYQHAGPWTQHAGPSRGLTSVAVRGCLLAHTRRLWLSVCVRVCLSAHTGRLWLYISTHISKLVLGRSTLALTVDCSGDFGPRGLSVQKTQDVCGCPSAYTGRLRVSVSAHRTFVAVRVCPFVSVSTHRTSVAIHQYKYQHVGPWTQHAGPSRGLFG
ncbi:hypothetical protein YC2023_066044 [Brassica napus]